MIRSEFAAFLLLATPCIGQAKVFRTSYLETQLPPSWACERKETEWLCRDNDTLKSREAIVVFTAKKTSPTETITDFKKYIESPKTIRTARNKILTSKVLWVREFTNFDQPWINGLHINSELEDFYTYYYATKYKDLSILATYSVAKESYQKFSGHIKQFTQSLRVLKTYQPSPTTTGLQGGLGQVGGATGLGTAQLGEAGAPPPKSSKSNPFLLYGLIGFAVLLGVLFALKKRS